MPVTLPKTWIALERLTAAQLNANFLALAGKFQTGAGGIVDADCATTMALKGSKISAVAGERIPTDRIEDLNITTAKFALLSVTEATIAALAVTKGKLGLAAVSWAQVSKATAEVQLTVLLGSGSVASGGSLANEIPLATFNNSTMQLLDAYLVRKSGVSTFTPGAFRVQTFIDDTDNKLKVVATNTRTAASTLEAEYWLRMDWMTRT